MGWTSSHTTLYGAKRLRGTSRETDEPSWGDRFLQTRDAKAPGGAARSIPAMEAD